MSRLGIISGAGDLPHIAMKEALLHGEDPIFLAVKESDFSPGEFQERVIPIHITQIGGLIKTCKKNNINRLILLGKVNKDIILKSFKFDLKSIILMAKMLNKNDYTFFEVASHEFLKNKIEILSQKLYLQTLLLPPGRYTKKKLKSGDLETIQYGMNLAYELARLDIGQSVVVMDRMTLALEAIEGTDEAIKRGGILSRFKGATLCKSSKPGQDERFDLPTVGLQTLKIMNEYKYKNLSIQSGETLIINPKEFIKFADDSGINVLSYDTKQELSELNKSTKPLP
ncbi:MAG: UDP-2,3-diacylglucosamine diphosphatase LpxI [Leptospiraceae bacterium]|nr:UDP-2,3-diacylglucosamine diphosphatase LpxI [Leptospiraceae bacterium]MCP5511925.1 UDP-2,3-diacylglucosamine diphosphatase LpxI [Leptospiraceae bacterium]